MNTLLLDNPRLDEAVALYRKTVNDDEKSGSSEEHLGDVYVSSEESENEDLPWDMDTLYDAPHDAHSDGGVVSNHKDNEDLPWAMDTMVKPHPGGEEYDALNDAVCGYRNDSCVRSDDGENESLPWDMDTFMKFLPEGGPCDSPHGAITGTQVSDGVKPTFEVPAVSQSSSPETCEPLNIDKQPNMFIMLAQHGNFLLPSNFLHSGLQWANERDWVLCSIKESGYPWNLDNPGLVFSSLIPCLSSNLQRYVANSTLKKYECLTSEELHQEWKAYEKNRMQTLQSAGSQFLYPFLHTNDAEMEKTLEQGNRGLLHSNNSCALDSILFVFPALFWHIFKARLHGGGREGNLNALRAPGAALLHFVYNRLYKMESGFMYREDFHISLSNHLRVLMQDLASFFRICRNPLPRTWCPFSPCNEFLSISEVTWYILPRLLGAYSHVGCTTELQFRRIASKSLSDPKAFTSLAACLFDTILNRYQRSPRGCYLLSIAPDLSEKDIKVFKGLLVSSPLHADRGLELRIVAYLGYCFKSKKSHFISGLPFVSSTSVVNCHVYDGMKHRGMARTATVKSCFDDEEPIFLISSLLAFTVCSSSG